MKRMNFRLVSFFLAICLVAGLTVHFTSSSHAHIEFTDNAYKPGDDYALNPLDPINVIWYKLGSAWDVDYDFTHWLSPTWRHPSLVSSLQVYFLDSINGGKNYWKTQDYHVADPGSSDIGTRVHVRIWGSNTYDPHGYASWSVGGAHKESWCWWCLTHHVSSWEAGESKVRDAFAGKWFVGDIWYYWLTTEGYWEGVWSDAWATAIELLN